VGFFDRLLPSALTRSDGEPLDRIIGWCREREAIRQRKAAGDAPPWTRDPILAAYRFCCVRREDDATTVWIRKNIREPFATDRYLWLMLCIARQINLPDSLTELIARRAWPTDERFHTDDLEDVLLARQERGERLLRAAYIVHPDNDPASPWYRKPMPIYIARGVIRPLWKDRDRFAAYFDKSPRQRSLEAVHSLLMQYPGWAEFMAYQAVVDMRWTALLDQARDISTWAAAGPGTCRGLNRLHRWPVETRITQEQALAELRELVALLRERLPEMQLDLSDCPNIVCEFDKHERGRLGEGKLKRRYRPD